MLLEGVAAFWTRQNNSLFNVWLNNIQPKHHPSSSGLDTHSESLQNKPGPCWLRHVTGFCFSPSFSTVFSSTLPHEISPHLFTYLSLRVSNLSETNRRFRITLTDLQVGGLKNVGNHSGRVYPHSCRVQLCSWSTLCLFGAFMFHPGAMETQPGANGLKPCQ